MSSKIGAQIILRGILDLPIDVDAIPEDFGGTSHPDTVVLARTVRAIDGVHVELYTD